MNSLNNLFMSKLRDWGVPLSEVDVEALETELGERLPADYREFMLLRNGGRFYQPLVYRFPKVPDRGWDLDHIDILTFYSLLEPADDNIDDLRRVLGMHRGRIPARTLPIADDDSDMILLDLDPKSGGSLWLWVRDDEFEVSPEENRIPIAPSFSLLVSECREDPDSGSHLEEEEAFVAIERYDLERLRNLLDAGLPCNSRQAEGITLLFFACECLNYEAAELLLNRGADPNLPDPRFGYSPFLEAARLGALDLARLLLRHGARRQTRSTMPMKVYTHFRRLGFTPYLAKQMVQPTLRGRMAQLLSGNAAGGIPGIPGTPWEFRGRHTE